MNTEVLLILNLACVSALLWFFDYPYRRFRVDLLRFHLFVARDQLFDAAAKGEIPFNHPAYWITRQTLNGMIRFAHEISLWRVLILTSTSRYWASAETMEHGERYEKAFKSLTERQQSIVYEVMMDAHVSLVAHVLHTSLLSFPGVMLAKVVFRFLGTVVDAVRTLPAPVLEAVDTEAYFCGEDEPLLKAA